MADKLTSEQLAEIQVRQEKRLLHRKWQDVDLLLAHCTALEEELKAAQGEIERLKTSQTNFSDMVSQYHGDR